MLRRHRKAFLLGCIELDFNIFSYLRGMRRYKKFHGHNAENSFMFLVHCADVFDENAPRSAWDYFRLGTAIHYIADAFTASHNGFWTGSLLEHSAYETALHREFKAMLEYPTRKEIPRHLLLALRPICTLLSPVLTFRGELVFQRKRVSCGWNQDAGRKALIL